MGLIPSFSFFLVLVPMCFFVFVFVLVLVFRLLYASFFFFFFSVRFLMQCDAMHPFSPLKKILLNEKKNPTLTEAAHPVRPHLLLLLISD